MFSLTAYESLNMFDDEGIFILKKDKYIQSTQGIAQIFFFITLLSFAENYLKDKVK